MILGLAAKKNTFSFITIFFSFFSPLLLSSSFVLRRYASLFSLIFSTGYNAFIGVGGYVRLLIVPHFGGTSGPCLSNVGPAQADVVKSLRFKDGVRDKARAGSGDGT